jgi:hypothetical protein
MFNSCMSKNLKSELKKEENCTCDPSKRGIEGLPSALGCRPYGERPVDCTNYINHLLLVRFGTMGTKSSVLDRDEMGGLP